MGMDGTPRLRNSRLLSARLHGSLILLGLSACLALTGPATSAAASSAIAVPRGPANGSLVTGDTVRLTVRGTVAQTYLNGRRLTGAFRSAGGGTRVAVLRRGVLLTGVNNLA